MPCYHPLTGHLLTLPDGKRKVLFNRNIETSDECPEITVPCGKCIGCRLEYSRKWAIRCMHEASMHDRNCFVTLTYSDEFCPEHLIKKDLQKWQKRLRKMVNLPIRFFSCGEYGETTHRPHYHALVFGWSPPDRELLFVSNGLPVYRSKMLEKSWPFGIVSIGEVTFESAAYVARYSVKKQLKAFYDYNDFSHFGGSPDREFVFDGSPFIDGDDSIFRKQEIEEDYPPFLLMSRRPGIGRSWYDRYKREVHANDFVFLRGRKLKVPRYYDERLKEDDLNLYESIKLKRQTVADAHAEDSTVERLKVREKLHFEKSKRLYRD